MFQVFDNGKPADEDGFPKLKEHGWETSKFETFAEAEKYALHWLGQWAPEPGVLQLNIPYDYNGYGDTILIKDISIKKMTATTEVKVHNSTKAVRIKHNTDWSGTCTITHTTDGDMANSIHDVPGWLGLNLLMGLKIGNKCRGEASGLSTDAAELITALLANKR